MDTIGERGRERGWGREYNIVNSNAIITSLCPSVCLCVYVCSRVLNGRRASFGGDLTSGSSLNTVTASRYVQISQS